ncbi:MAG: tol-pal system protein YbgF [Proteobacteria bacterium]|nr:tol-pal system protein YbgF [Pseudomonadota bacterium]
MGVAVKTLRVPLLAAMLAGCATTTPPEEDPVFLKLTDLEARLIRIERVIDNQSLIELTTRVDQLQSEIQTVRGETETLAFQTDNAGERQRDLYVDVDGRLQELELTLAQLQIQLNDFLAEEEAPPPPVLLPGSDQDNYQAAFNLLRDGNYEESASALEQFLAVFPSSPLADNAQYWLAETYYVQRQYMAALPAFQLVVDEYPGSSKLPDALLKIGFCNYELQQWGAAREALQRVIREFPATTAARLATQRLERIVQEQG